MSLKILFIINLQYRKKCNWFQQGTNRMKIFLKVNYQRIAFCFTENQWLRGAANIVSNPSKIIFKLCLSVSMYVCMSVCLSVCLSEGCRYFQNLNGIWSGSTENRAQQPWFKNSISGLIVKIQKWPPITGFSPITWERIKIC